jgi:hypothetical protein
MVPFTEFIAARLSLTALLQLVRAYSLTLGQLLTVLGYGYKAKANASKPLFAMPRRLRNYILTFYGPGGPAYSGLKGWLPMKSATTLFKFSVERARDLATRFFETEVKLALEALEALQPLITEAKRLGTVYRDREHYGTVPRSPKPGMGEIPNPDLTVAQPVPIGNGTRYTETPKGVERSTPLEVVDALNELVYREAFMDTVIDHRNLRTELEEISPPSLDWDGVEEIWAKIRDLEQRLGSLPLPKNIYSRASDLGKPDTSQGKLIRRWYRHSGTFRTTVNPVES